MPVYKVRAIGAEGRTRVLREEARSEGDVARALGERGLTLTRVLRVSAPARTAGRRTRVARQALAHFTDRLQILYAAGVPLADAVAEAVQGSGDPKLLPIGRQIESDLREGRSLSEALEEFPRAFPAAFRAAIEAGETSGALDTVLGRLTHQIEWEQQIKAAVIQAFIYPAILLGAVTGLIAFLLAWLLPRLMKVFVQAGVELPGATKVVLWTSSFIQSRGLWLLAVAGLAVAGLGALRATARGRVAMDRGLLRLPVFGRLLTTIASARFTGTLRTLHQAGTPMLKALDLSRAAAGNACLAAEIGVLAERVADGRSLTDSMAAAGHLDPLVPRMVAVGEMSGSLSDALDHVSRFYDREIKSRTKRMLAVLEPAILLGSGLVVGFVIFATLLPMFRLFGAIKR